MLTIGLLGGMSWESSIVYEQIINTEVRARLGGVHSASLLVRSYDFAQIERLQAAGDWEQAGRLLAADACWAPASPWKTASTVTGSKPCITSTSSCLPRPTGLWCIR